MRLDKFLKVARIFKRRSVSKNIISFGNVTINGRKAKPATNINENDLVSLILGNTKITIRIKAIKENIKKEEALTLYEVIEEIKLDNNQDEEN